MDVLDPLRLAAELTRTGEVWAEAEAAAQLLEETRKAVLAQIATRHDGSEAARDRMAHADAGYFEHVEKMVAARRAANLAKVRWIAVQTKLDMIRTAESSRRAEMRMAG
jgi:hypothetical protein